MRVVINLIQPTCRGKKSEFWTLRWRDPTTGKIRKESTGLRQRNVAERMRVDKERQLEREVAGEVDEVAKNRGMTWADYKTYFLNTYVVKLKPGSRQVYDSVFAAWSRHVGEIKLTAITDKVLAEFVAARLKEVRPATVDRDLRQIRTALKFAVGKYIRTCPSFKSLFIRADLGDPIEMEQADIAAILQALGKDLSLRVCTTEWWKVLFQTVLFTGMRLGEVLGLRWKSVDFKAEKVTVLWHTCKTAKTREYPGCTALVNLLKAWKRQQPTPPTPDNFVFPWVTPTIKTRRQLYDDWYAIQDAAGIPKDRQYRPKDTRSTCASQLLKDGISTLVTANWLGHSVAVLEKHYANLLGAKQEVSARRTLAS